MACFCHLTAPLGLSQPTVSHHLKVLLEAGRVEREQRGNGPTSASDQSLRSHPPAFSASAGLNSRALRLSKTLGLAATLRKRGLESRSPARHRSGSHQGRTATQNAAKRGYSRRLRTGTATRNPAWIDPLTFMVRRGSTVRVRQRALKDLQIAVSCCLC